MYGSVSDERQKASVVRRVPVDEPFEKVGTPVKTESCRGETPGDPGGVTLSVSESSRSLPGGGRFGGSWVPIFVVVRGPGVEDTGPVHLPLV